MKRVTQSLLMAVLIVGLIVAFDVFFPNLVQSGTARGLSDVEEINSSVSGTPGGDSFVSAPDQQVVGTTEEESGDNPADGGVAAGGKDAQSIGDSEGAVEEIPPNMITEPEILGSILLLVNKQNALPADYVPADLVTADVRFAPHVLPEKKKLRSEAAEALEELIHMADQEDIELYCVSGYRAYATQEAIFNNKVKAAGLAYAVKYVARPGQSEHQTGLAMDMTNRDGVNRQLTENFGETKEGQWLQEKAWRFGFIIRYPAGREDITGYNYEPWHIRYVGKNAAQFVKDRDITLEEYLTG